MTDPRPEITAKADGANIVVTIAERVDPMFLGKIGWIKSATLSPQECFVLQRELSAAYQAVAEYLLEQGKAAFRVDNGYGLESPSEEEAKINFREWT